MAVLSQIDCSLDFDERLQGMIKIATYNVNGINGRLAVLLRWLKEARPDIVCLQELKTTSDRFPANSHRKSRVPGHLARTKIVEWCSDPFPLIAHSGSAANIAGRPFAG